MKLYQLLEHAKRFPVFQIEDCQKWFSDDKRGVLLLQLAEYVRKGHLLRLRRGLYLLNSEPWPHPFVIASRLKPESVISLETILCENGILPETSFAVTALTAGRNSHYSLGAAGNFIFRHIQPRLLFGWRLEQFPPYSARVVEPEKALLDFLWFHQREKKYETYLEGLRLFFPANFSWSKFNSLARSFNHPRLQKLANQVERKYRRR